MANEDNIKIYSASDIRKYHEGRLSAAEMHEMEKASLEDPLLSDALEGMLVAGPGLDNDLADLQSRLKEVTGDKKIVPLIPEKKSGGWLRIAAMAAIVAGAALLVYQFAFNRKDDVIALRETNAPAVPAGAPQSRPVTTEIPPAGAAPLADEIAQVGPPNSASRTPAPGLPLAARKESTPEPGIGSTASADPVVMEVDGLVGSKQEDESKAAADSLSASVGFTAGRSKKEAGNPNAITRAISARSRNATVFRGQVMDERKNPVPFANIIVPETRQNTYSDARGKFQIIAEDTAVDVQVRSLGYLSQSVGLQNSNLVSENKIQLQPDQVVTSNNNFRRQVNTSKAVEQRTVAAGAEPVDGWVNYDLYVNNNLRRQDAGMSGEVELSFELNSAGTPVNVKVVRTLCAACDKEAIRLLVEGPKWKPDSRKGVTAITISF